nr:MAG TPA: hypothetical protein [Caudoviricetes sp.]
MTLEQKFSMMKMFLLWNRKEELLKCIKLTHLVILS